MGNASTECSAFMFVYMDDLTLTHVDKLEIRPRKRSMSR